MTDPKPISVSEAREREERTQARLDSTSFWLARDAVTNELEWDRRVVATAEAAERVHHAFRVDRQLNAACCDDHAIVFYHSQDTNGECPACLCKPRSPAAERRWVPVTFDEAWEAMRAKGYDYGEDALENVRLGWNLAHGLVVQQRAETPAQPEV